MEARDHGTPLNNPADAERARLRAYGNQLISAHITLRAMLEDVYDAVESGDDTRPGFHCLAFCDAVTRHHTAEDRSVFPFLAARHPELRAFLADLERDHQVIAGLLARLREAATVEELDGISAVLETHFIGEEKRLVAVLDAVDPAADGLDLGAPGQDEQTGGADGART